MTPKDWTGNRRSSIVTNGGRNYTETEREPFDYYATDPRAVPPLLENESFKNIIWECACGEKHLSNEIEKHGYKTINTDLIIRGGGMTQLDFLKYVPDTPNQLDIITNPPYKHAKQFIEHAIEISAPGVKIAMFLKLTFLETKNRYRFFMKHPPKKVYVFSHRVQCAMNGRFDIYSNNAVAYAWYVWVVGWNGEPVIRWLE